jgi:hypothetical protein
LIRVRSDAYVHRNEDSSQGASENVNFLYFALIEFRPRVTAAQRGGPRAKSRYGSCLAELQLTARDRAETFAAFAKHPLAVTPVGYIGIAIAAAENYHGAGELRLAICFRSGRTTRIWRWKVAGTGVKIQYCDLGRIEPFPVHHMGLPLSSGRRERAYD